MLLKCNYVNKVCWLKQRLNKVISLLGICSRRDADRLISSGQILVNGEIVSQLGVKVLKGDKILYNNKEYEVIDEITNTMVWIYYKPVGIITTHKDPENRNTVFEKIKPQIKERVVSVGRLDINSEGLLILTNNPSYASKLELPLNSWKRVYKVRVFGAVTKEIISKIQEGLTIEGVKYRPMTVSIINISTNNTWVLCELSEGKNREIRKIFSFFGIQVNRLIRISYGPYELGSLCPGEIRSIGVKSDFDL